MQLAHDWLQDGATVLDVTRRFGYKTEAAFHRAFKRETRETFPVSSNAYPSLEFRNPENGILMKSLAWEKNHGLG